MLILSFSFGERGSKYPSLTFFLFEREPQTQKRGWGWELCEAGTGPLPIPSPYKLTWSAYRDDKIRSGEQLVKRKGK